MPPAARVTDLITSAATQGIPTPNHSSGCSNGSDRQASGSAHGR
jgi:hypothetical protein